MISFERLEANLSNILATFFVPLAVDGMPPTRCLPEAAVQRPSTPKTPSEHPSLLTNTCFHFPAPVCTSTPIPCTPGKSLDLSQDQRTFRARSRYCDSLLSGSGRLSLLRRKRLRTPPVMRFHLSPAKGRAACRLISYTDRRGSSPALRRQKASCRLTAYPAGLEGCSFGVERRPIKTDQADEETAPVERSASPQTHSCTLRIDAESTLVPSHCPSDSPGSGGSYGSCCSQFVPSVTSKVFATVAYILIMLAKKTVVPSKYQQFFTTLQEQFWQELCG